MKKWKLVLLITAAVVFVGAAGVYGVQGIQNKAIALEQAVEIAEYDKHEAEVLQAIVDGRGGAAGFENVSTAIEAVAEAYPELKSNENYKQYMTELATTENLIAQYRSNYNTQVGAYKRYVGGFPSRIFLDWTGYEPVEYKKLDYGAPTDAPTNMFGD